MKVFKPVPNILSIGTITIRKEGRSWAYKPKKDITAYEVSLLIVMFSHFHVSTIAMYDYRGYVEENKLERHFEEIK